MFKDMDDVMVTVRELTQDQLSEVVVAAVFAKAQGDITEGQLEFVVNTVLGVMAERELAEGAIVN